MYSTKRIPTVYSFFNLAIVLFIFRKTEKHENQIENDLVEDPSQQAWFLAKKTHLPIIEFPTVKSVPNIIQILTCFCQVFLKTYENIHVLFQQIRPFF